MKTTTNLQITSLVSAQAQKHVTVNEAFARIDAASQMAVLDRDLTDPPAAPSDGDRYLIAPGATDDWSGHDGEIAAWESATQGWLFLAPRPGWRVWIIDENALLVFTDGAWQSVGGGSGGAASLNPASGGLVGINTTADAINRLTVKSDAVLFSHDDVTPGTGDMRLTLNKAVQEDDTSLTLQRGFSTRAQIGLTGDDDLHFKVSADGSTFTEALTLDHTTGDVRLEVARIAPGIGSFPNTLPDGGRFCDWTAAQPLYASSFAAPAYINAYNGSTLSDGGQFEYNNSTHGGPGNPLPSAIDELVQKIRGGGNKRHGVEWHALKVVPGTGTNISTAVGTDTYYQAMTYTVAALYPVMTMGAYIKVLTGGGKALPSLSNVTAIRFNGINKTLSNADIVLDDTDGWVWVEVEINTPAIGYSHLSNTVSLTPGTELLYALPKVVAGRARLHGLEVLAHQLFYGSAGV